jgi:hypothetical protein
MTTYSDEEIDALAKKLDWPDSTSFIQHMVQLADKAQHSQHLRGRDKAGNPIFLEVRRKLTRREIIRREQQRIQKFKQDRLG